MGTTFFSVGPPPVGNSDLLGFWPVLGLGHLEIFQARAKNRKTQFPGARGPETEKESYHAVRDGCPLLSSSLSFDRPDSHRREGAKYEDFGPFWPRTALGRNPGTGPKAERRNFLALGVPKSKKKVTTLSGMVVHNFLTSNVLADRTPTGGESRNTGVSRPFWPRTALGTWRNSERKTEKRKQPH